MGSLIKNSGQHTKKKYYMKVNKIKGKNRTDLAIMFGELGFKRGAEIGVRAGKYSEILCTHVKGLEKLYP